MNPLRWLNVVEDINAFLQPDISSKPTDSNIPGAYLQYNEYIAYDVDQIRLRYLFRVKMN
jgi:hypothetical protein